MELFFLLAVVFGIIRGQPPTDVTCASCMHTSVQLYNVPEQIKPLLAGSLSSLSDPNCLTSNATKTVCSPLPSILVNKCQTTTIKMRAEGIQDLLPNAVMEMTMITKGCAPQPVGTSDNCTDFKDMDANTTKQMTSTLDLIRLQWIHVNYTGVMCTGNDQSCHNAGGHCQYGFLQCAGAYISGLCSGPGKRQCCIPAHSSGSSSSGYLCYGDMMKLHPTGRSSGGVGASHRELDSDISTLNAHKSCYVTAGKNNCIHPSLIAALASRESHAGRLLNSTNGWGDHHNAYGVLQCDVKHCPVCSHGLNCTTYEWNTCQHIDMMTKYVLVPFIESVQHKHPNWPRNHQLQGGIAAYNFGPGNVQSWGGLDIGSSGDDYSNDVVARAQYLVNYYGW